MSLVAVSLAGYRSAFSSRTDSVYSLYCCCYCYWLCCSSLLAWQERSNRIVPTGVYGVAPPQHCVRRLSPLTFAPFSPFSHTTLARSLTIISCRSDSASHAPAGICNGEDVGEDWGHRHRLSDVRFLDDSSAQTYLQTQRSHCIHQGSLDGLLLSGITEVVPMCTWSVIVLHAI